MDIDFIILEPDPIVRLDVEGMLIAQYPRCQIEAGISLSEIGSVVQTSGPGSTLFVRGTLIAESDDLARLLKAAVTRRSQVVIIGEARKLDFPASFVDPPFTTDMLLAAIRRDAPKDPANSSA